MRFCVSVFIYNSKLSKKWNHKHNIDSDNRIISGSIGRFRDVFIIFIVWISQLFLVVTIVSQWLLSTSCYSYLYLIQSYHESSQMYVWWQSLKASAVRNWYQTLFTLELWFIFISTKLGFCLELGDSAPYELYSPMSVQICRL